MPWADVGFLAFQRELGFGGGLLAGGLAYRLFLWLLPVGLLGAQILVRGSANEEASRRAKSAGRRGRGRERVECRRDDPTKPDPLILSGSRVAWFSLGFGRALQLGNPLAFVVPRPRMPKPLTP